MVYIVSNELTHYGILGQKWGIRRYQNEDGTLTETGKKRYKTVHPDYTRAHSKKVQEMSDEELKRAVIRINNERAYKNSQPKKKTIIDAIKFVTAAGSAILAAEVVGSKLVDKGQFYIDKFGDIVISNLAEGLIDFKI